MDFCNITQQDCRTGRITTDYQNALEQEWIKSLKKKYKVKVNQKVLKEYKASIEATK